MKILYLKPEHGRPFFYADPAEVARSPAARSTGLRGLAERKWDEIEAAWKGSNGSAARWSRRVWDWLHTWSKPDEPLLAKLATADSIEIRHPSATPVKKVRAAWKRYLARRGRSHLFWLLIDGALAPVTGLALWLIPGPNVVGFWFTYRAYNHYSICRAVHRARWSPPPIRFLADEALDKPIHRDHEGLGYAHAAVEAPENLHLYLERKPADEVGHDHDHDHEHDDPAESGPPRVKV